MNSSDQAQLLSLVRSLIVDVESMVDHGVSPPSTESCWFGPFWDAKIDQEGQISVEWPNLRISVNAIRERFPEVMRP